MATNTIKKDMIPYRAGVVIIAPIVNGKPDYAKAYSTARDFLTSTQITTSKEYETLPNGNGSDKDYPTSETHNLAVVTQTYDYEFHSMISGKEKVVSAKPVPVDRTFTVSGSETYEVDLTDDEPAAMEDKKYYFIIKDSNGNKLQETTETVATGQYKYDSMTKKLSFFSDMANATVNVVMWKAVTDIVEFKSSPTPQNKEFLIETFGEVQSAATGEIFYRRTRLERATVTGDIPDMMKQKSINAPITYNFATAPMPVGESVLTESMWNPNTKG